MVKGVYITRTCLHDAMNAKVTSKAGDCFSKIYPGQMSHVMRKPVFCICENKDADQLRSNCAADQRLCFRYTDRTIPLLPKSEISSLWPSSVAVQPGVCRTWSETPKTGFLRTRLKLKNWRICFVVPSIFDTP